MCSHVQSSNSKNDKGISCLQSCLQAQRSNVRSRPHPPPQSSRSWRSRIGFLSWLGQIFFDPFIVLSNLNYKPKCIGDLSRFNHDAQKNAIMSRYEVMVETANSSNKLRHIDQSCLGSDDHEAWVALLTYLNDVKICWIKLLHPAPIC